MMCNIGDRIMCYMREKDVMCCMGEDECDVQHRRWYNVLHGREGCDVLHGRDECDMQHRRQYNVLYEREGCHVLHGREECDVQHRRLYNVLH